MAIMKVHQVDSGWDQIPRLFSQDLTITNQSRGLLLYMVSLPSDWVLYKTELMSKFPRREVENVFNDLINAKYLVHIKVRVGGNYQHLYHVRVIPFTDTEIKRFVATAPIDAMEQYRAECKLKNRKIKEDANISDVQIVQSTNHTPKVATTYLDINTSPQKEITDVDSGMPFDLSLGDVEKVDTDATEEEKKLDYKIYTESEIENFNKKATAYYSFYLTKQQIQSSIRKIYKKYLDGYAKDYPKLLDADLHKKEDKAREKKQLEYKKDETVETTPYTGRVPFYNWLEN